MPKPRTRLPQAVEDPATQAEPAQQVPAALAPAPDNGVPFSQQIHQVPARPAPPAIKRRGKQLGLRIPDDLYQRLVACADATRIPQSRLLERALDAELKIHGF